MLSIVLITTFSLVPTHHHVIVNRNLSLNQRCVISALSLYFMSSVIIFMWSLYVCNCGILFTLTLCIEVLVDEWLWWLDMICSYIICLWFYNLSSFFIELKENNFFVLSKPNNCLLFFPFSNKWYQNMKLSVSIH